MDLASVTDLLDNRQYAELVGNVASFVEAHSNWIANDCLNLVSAHNIMSPYARAMLSSGLADKIMAGRIGMRDHAGAWFIDQIDEICVRVAQRLFNAGFVEYRSTSGSMANEIAIYTCTKPGEKIIAWPLKYGAHYTYRELGFPQHRNLRIYDVPCEEEDYIVSIDFNSLRKLAHEVKPSLIILGTSTALFPYPLREVAAIAEEVGARVHYDGAHVLGLIAGGSFQDPLREGATILTGSTQKTIPGPVGGLVLCNDDQTSRKIVSCTDSIMANYHNNRIAALTVALIELLSFGRDLAREIINNARTLAQALSKQDFEVLAKKNNFTASHQLLIDISGRGDTTSILKKLEAANILCTRIPLPKDYGNSIEKPSGLRLGTNVVTRLGMGPSEMREIANFIARVIIDGEDPHFVATEVSEFKKPFGELKYVLPVSIPC